MDGKYLYILTFNDFDNKMLIGVFSTYIRAICGITNIIDKVGKQKFLNIFGYTEEELDNLQEHITQIKSSNSKILELFYKVKGDKSKLNKKQINMLYHYDDLKCELLEGYLFDIKQVIMDKGYDPDV